MTERWLALILAAGAGRRLGGVPKCLMTLAAQTVLERLLRAVAEALPGAPQRLVLGHHAQAIEAALQAMSLGFQPQRVINPNPGDDPVDSLHLGLRGLPEGHTAVMILLADLPLLAAEDLQAARRVFEARGPAVELVWPQVNDTPGHPVMLSHEVARELLVRPGMSLRSWRRENPGRVSVWQTDRQALITDVDDRPAFEALRHRTGLDWQLPGSCA